MSQNSAVREKGTATCHNTVGSATDINLGGYRALRLYFPAGFTAGVDVFELDVDDATYIDSNIDVAVPTVLPGSTEVDAAIFGAERIKLKSAVADNGKSIGYRLKS